MVLKPSLQHLVEIKKPVGLVANAARLNSVPLQGRKDRNTNNPENDKAQRPAPPIRTCTGSLLFEELQAVA